VEPLRVGVVEEDEIVRRGMVAVLAEEDCECVVIEADGELPSGAGDASFGLDVAVVCSRVLGRMHLECPIVCLAHPELRGVESCRSWPSVMATLPHEGLSADELVASVRAAAAGLQVESTSLKRQNGEVMDPRRIGVLKLLATGSDTRAIARELQLSERTVKTLIHDIQLTLGASTRAQAVAEGIRLGLI
jgi:DNA-binding CsgD family transcriptional regulator